MYWILNTVVGLYTVNLYNDYLTTEYPDLMTNITIFATKWFSSVILTFAILTMLAFGSVMPCFGDLETLKQLVVGLALPTYIFCVVTQQIFSSGYGAWFFMNLENEEVTKNEIRFNDMDPDCLDLVKFFFLNECIVGFLTLFQCMVIMCCGFMKSRHLREIEGEVDDNSKRTKYFMDEIKQSRAKSIQSGPSSERSKKSKSRVSFAEYHNDDSIDKENEL